AATAVMRLGRSGRENLPAQLRFFEPARNRTLEHSRPALAESSPGDDEHAAPARGARGLDKAGECPMRLGLGHPMQVEACLDPVQTAPPPFGIGAVDPGKAV